MVQRSASPLIYSGVANGLAPLDSGAKVPIANLPASIAGALSYQGVWNASTNTPTLTSSVGTMGYYYVVSVAGSTTINTHNSWNIGDAAIFNGTAWDQLVGSSPVQSVSVAGTGLSENASIGAITITSNATNANTASTIVSRDGSGNFSAGTISATLSGNATTATSATTAANIANNIGTTTTVLHGNAAGAPSFGAVALGTDVSGTLAAAQFPALTGDITTSAGNLSTTMKNTGTAGTYGQVTTDAQGRVSSGTIIADPTHGGTGIANNSASTITISGNFAATYTLTGVTAVTLPTSGTLATTAQITGTNSGTNTGDQLIFKTISVSGQSDIVADTTSDTLTIVAGTGVTLTTDSTTDTLTITNSSTSGLLATTQSAMEAGTDNTTAVTPLSAKWSPSAAKCWIVANGSGTSILASHNITSITDTGTGVLTVTIATDFSSANYAICTTNNDGQQIGIGTGGAAQTSGVFALHATNLANVAVDPDQYNAVCFGDQ